MGRCVRSVDGVLLGDRQQAALPRFQGCALLSVIGMTVVRGLDALARVPNRRLGHVIGNAEAD